MFFSSRVAMKSAVWALTFASLATASVGSIAQSQSQSQAIANDMERARPQQADPANTSASVPMVVYRSALAGVRRLASPEVNDWRQSNAMVNKHSGGRAPEPGGEARTDEATGGAMAPPEAPHQGHRGK
jgi:hypothetical protein